MRIGFLGLGIMGAPMAGHLIDAGHSVASAVHKTPAPAELLDKGLAVLQSPAAVAEHADVIITMVSDTPDVEDVLFAKAGVAAGLSPGKIFVDMSSISPLATKKFARKIEKLGCDYVDAPVSGGDVGAQEATLTIMVGGNDAAVTKVRPLFELMGRTITHIGGCGDGQTAKIANQIIVAMTIQAVSEALVFASKAGADVAAVRSALLGGFANSRILELHGERMIKRNFEPGFKVSLHNKDLNNALAGASELGIALPGTAGSQGMLEECIAMGGGDWDSAAMLRAIELLAKHEIG